MQHNQPYQLGYVLDIDMVASFFAFAKKNDFTAGRSESAKTVWAIAIVWIIVAVDECRANQCQRSGKRLPQGDFPR